jgi:predicted enzyme related to lactoylglutathione lyase
VVLAFFGADEDHFPRTQPAMLNLQVDDLDGLLERLAAAGVPVDPERPSYDFGRFGWITDPEGNRIELWQPAPES